jgi:hypothetical protein
MLVLMTMLATRLAAPVDDGVSLQWTAPPECPDAEAVRAEARRRSRDETRPVEAIGNVHKSGDEWVLELTLKGTAVEQRTIRASSCAAIAEAAGLLIAVAADPTLDETPTEPVTPETPIEGPVVAPVEPPPLPPDDPPRTIARDRPSPRPPPAPPKRRTKPRALLGVDAIGQFLRVLPAVAGFGVGGTIGVMWPRARAELRGHYYLPSTSTYADAPDAGGRVDLWTIAPAGCWSPLLRSRQGSRSSLTLPLCTGVELGGMRGRAIGVEDRGSATSLFVSITVDGSLVYSPIPRLGLRLGPQVAVVARRPRFHVRGRDQLFQAGPAAIRLVAGIELRLP